MSNVEVLLQLKARTVAIHRVRDFLFGVRCAAVQDNLRLINLHAFHKFILTAGMPQLFPYFGFQVLRRLIYEAAQRGLIGDRVHHVDSIDQVCIQP